MGRVRLELTTLGLKVRPRVLRRAAGDGNVLQISRVKTAMSGSQERRVETSVYAHPYAQMSLREATQLARLGWAGRAAPAAWRVVPATAGVTGGTKPFQRVSLSRLIG
jgi:hypothetical protein